MLKNGVFNKSVKLSISTEWGPQAVKLWVADQGETDIIVRCMCSAGPGPKSVIEQETLPWWKPIYKTQCQTSPRVVLTTEALVGHITLAFIIWSETSVSLAHATAN